MDIKETQITRLTLNEGDVLLVRVDRNNLPKGVWAKHATEIKNILSTYFLTNQIVVHDESTTFTVVEAPKNVPVAKKPRKK